VKNILCSLIFVYILVIIVRSLMSFFPIRPGTPLASVALVLRDITEPVLAPIRRVVGPVGMFDLSPMILIFALILLQGVLC
jgi:YggT family protein